MTIETKRPSQSAHALADLILERLAYELGDTEIFDTGWETYENLVTCLLQAGVETFKGDTD